MTMPNFLIIGAAKSGSTALYSYLNQHPEIYMSPIKEAKFFSYEDEAITYKGPNDLNQGYFTDLKSYQSLFSGVSNEIAVGEASPYYLYIPGSAYRINKHIPNAKLIAILRNPIDRAYSHFRSYIIRNEPIADFNQAILAETERIYNNWSPRWYYKQQGFYYKQLKPYFELFDRNQIKIYLYEDFADNMTGVLADIFSFLSVDESFQPHIQKRHNVTNSPRNLFLHHLVSPIGKNKGRNFLQKSLPKNVYSHVRRRIENANLRAKPVALSKKSRLKLIDIYKEDIHQLQDLIGQDCLHWLSNG